MADYRIVCTEQEPFSQPTTHAHIVAVGSGNDPDKADTRWTLDEVLGAMDRGNRFYTVSPTTDKIALVEKYTCDKCWRTFIRSAPDAVRDNNLDSLRRCRFS